MYLIQKESMKRVKDLLRFLESVNENSFNLLNHHNIEMVSNQTFLKIQKIVDYINKMSKN